MREGLEGEGEVGQSFANHTRIVPLYHRVTLAIVVAALAWAVYGVAREPTLDRAVMLVLVVAVAFIMAWSRFFALGVQDRVIRLEERLRMARVLPEDLRPRIEELRTEDLIALRFASDGELPGLVRRVLAGEFADSEAIKRAVTSWRADHQRI